MKQFFSYLGASLAAIAALASCNKEIEAPVEDLKGGVPFEICASTADTKTAIDGFATSWVAADSINLFHAVAGATSYTSDGKFTITDLAANKFKGTLNGGLTAESYDWYAFYPYSKYNKTPAGSSQDDFGFTTIGGTAQTQTGNNSTAHLAGKPCPLYGVVKSVASNAAPTVEMNHLTSIVEVNVANNSGEDLTVLNVSFTGTEDIVGLYYINFAGTPVDYTKKSVTDVSNTVSLSVANGTAIANNTSAQFYIAVKPFSASAGQTLKVSVNGYSKDITLAKDVTFTAGKIKKVNFNFDKVVVDYVKLPWTEDFSEDLGIYTLENGGGTTKTYNEANAGGTAPELLVARNNGSFSAKVKATAGDAILTFKSNHPEYLVISVDNDKISLSKVSDTEYNLTIPSGVEFFNLTFTNTNSSNTRLDDISLKVDERTVLQTPNVLAELNTDNASVTNSINVVWDAIKNAGSYVVTATPVEGSVVSKPVLSDGSDTYIYTITGLAYEKAYTISVVAKPADTGLYKDSEPGVYSKTVKTGTKPATGGTPVPTDVTFDFTAIDGFADWGTGYAEHIVEYTEATVTFKSANRQTSTITDQPVSKGGDVIVVMKDNQTINSLIFSCKKWGNKTQTITLSTSVDGGTTWTTTQQKSSTFKLSVSDIASGVNAIKFTFSSTSNQIGYTSLQLNYNKAN